MPSDDVPHQVVHGDPSPNKGSDGIRLSVSRTILAHDRTLMAWIRTSASMISFGFTIYKFFQYLHGDKPVPAAERLLGPRGLALIMLGIGVLALLLATIDYRQQMAHLRESYREYGPFPGSIALAVASMVAGLGVFGVVIVLLRQ